MAKNMIRKALSLATGAALAGTGLIGLATPAQAAGELALEPAKGSVYAVPATDFFVLKSYFNTGYSSSEVAKLKLKVTTSGGFRVDNDAADFDSFANQSNAVTTQLIASNAATPSAVISAGASASPVYFGLAINSPGTTTNYDVTVQAFVDVDADGKIDSGEWTSQEQTIRFMKYSDVNWNLTLDALNIGDTTATANVSSSNINLAMLTTGASTSQVAAVFEDDTATAGTYVFTPDNGTSATAVALAYDSTDDRLEGTSDAFASSATLAAGDKVRAKVYYSATAVAEGALDTSDSNDADADDDTWDEIIVDETNDTSTAGTWSAFGTTDALAAEDTIIVTVGADTVSSMADVVTSATVNSAVNGTEVDIRQGATSFDAKVTVTPESGVSAAGIPVTFVIEEQGANTLAAGATITAGGKTLSNTNAGTKQKITVVANTDADGVAKIDLAAAGTKATNVVNISASASGQSSESDFTFVTPTINSVRVLNVVDGESTNAQVVVSEDAAFDLRFGVTDQFGFPVTDAGYSVRVSEGSTTLTGAVSNGTAVVSWPKYDDPGTKSFTAEGLKNGVDVGSSPDDTFGVTVIAAGAADAAAAISIAGTTSGTGSASDFGKTTSLGLNKKAFVAGDTRTGDQIASRTANEDVLVTGTVTKADGSAALTSVTLSGTGFDFISGGVYASDSITVHTDTSGQFTVKVLSNLAGDRTLTMTSGSVTKTQKFTYAAAADDAGTQLTLNVPAFVDAGKTVSVTGSLTDDFGNPVTADGTGEGFLVTYSGPGFNTTLPTQVNALGNFAFNILLGAGDTGSGTITVSYDQNNDSDYADSKDRTASGTFVIGDAPADQKVNAGSFKGYVAVYALGYEGQRLSAKIGNDWVIVDPIVNNESDDLHRTTDFTGAGVDIAVRIYIDRVLIDTINLTTK